MIKADPRLSDLARTMQAEKLEPKNNESMVTLQEQLFDIKGTVS